MRIHSKTVWDIETGVVVEDQCYEWYGPVAQCKITPGPGKLGSSNFVNTAYYGVRPDMMSKLDDGQLNRLGRLGQAYRAYQGLKPDYQAATPLAQFIRNWRNS